MYNFAFLPDLVLPSLRRILTDLRLRGNGHARLAYRYMAKVVEPELKRLASLSEREVDALIAAIPAGDSDD